jgi:hypothetical protein
MRKLLGQHGLSIYRIQLQPEFILYVVKAAGAKA